MRQLTLLVCGLGFALWAGCHGDDATASPTPAPGGGGGGSGGGPGVPVITTVQPATLPSPGGVPLTVLGSNFAVGAQVVVDQQLAAPLTMFPPYLITATAPRAPVGVQGPLDVHVVNPSGAIGTLLGAVTYVPVTVAASADPITALDVDLDAADVAHVIWQVATAAGPVETRVARSTDGGRTWSTPLVLQSTGNPVGRPCVAAGGGTVFAVWNERVGNTEQVTRAWSTDNGITWVSAAALATNGPLRPDADVGVDGSAAVCVAWLAAGAGGNGVHVHAMRGTAGGAFGTATVLTGTGSVQAHAPVVAADGAGLVLVVYPLEAVAGGARELWAHRSADGGATFAAGVPLTQSALTGTIPSAPQVDCRGAAAVVGWLSDRVDAQGRAVTDVLAAASSTAGQTWPTRAQVFPGLPNEPRLGLGAAVSGNGHAVVAWGSAAAAAVPEVMSARSIDGGATWPSVVARSGTPGPARLPVVAGGSGGIVLHAWADVSPDGTTWAVKIY